MKNKQINVVDNMSQQNDVLLFPADFYNPNNGTHKTEKNMCVQGKLFGGVIVISNYVLFVHS